MPPGSSANQNGFMLRCIGRTHWRLSLSLYLSLSFTAHRSTIVPNIRCMGSIKKPQAEAVTSCPLYSQPSPASEVSR